MAPFIAALAPLLTSLAANGLGMLGNAVMAKGKAVIEEKLGVDIESSMQTEEGRYKLLQLQSDHEEFLIQAALDNRKVDLDFYKVEVENTKSAREMNAIIQADADASFLAKTLPYIIDAGVITLTFALIILLFWAKIPTENKELMYMALGACLTWVGTILNFHRGSSANNQRKDHTIDKLATAGAAR